MEVWVLNLRDWLGISRSRDGLVELVHKAVKYTSCELVS